MNAYTPETNLVAPLGNASATVMRWTALVDAGNALALLAGTRDDAANRPARDFAAALAQCPAPRRRLADNAVADLAAIMESGLSALLAGQQRGGNTQPAARALWREYVNARDSLLDMIHETATQ
tara:strand:+ start:227 stop:598 length:372 start_codon:yes stop_codon:yes gene_type:complete